MKYVICSSHRAYDKVKIITDGKMQNYFQFTKGYQLTEIPNSKLAECLEVTGVRLGKFDESWLKCWGTQKEVA